MRAKRKVKLPLPPPKKKLKKVNDKGIKDRKETCTIYT